MIIEEYDKLNYRRISSIILLIYFMSWKEEKELIKEFGVEYEEYKKSIPMFIPRLRRQILKK